MAIDGVKIIDSDWANDIYSIFMELYDSNFTINEIIIEINKLKNECVDEIEEEIFYTTFALAMWEIGEIEEEIINIVESIIQNERGLKKWREESEELYLLRKKELNKFYKKIHTPKEKIRKRKKYLKVVNPIYKLGDCVYFSLDEYGYIPAVIANIFQNKNEYNYGFCFIEYNQKAKPIFEIYIKSKLFGRKIKDSFNEHGYVWGLDYVYVDHKDMLKIKNEFKIVGTIELDENSYNVGSFGYASNIEELENHYLIMKKQRLKPADDYRDIMKVGFDASDLISIDIIKKHIT